MPALILKPKWERSLLHRHPWVFSGAVARIDGQPAPGETIDILAADGQWLARGAYSPRSQIRARVWSFDRAEKIDESFFQHRLQRALALRRPLLTDAGTTACRLVNGESDGLPGLIVDRYADWAVCQFLAAGAEHWKDVFVECLQERMPDLSGVYERSDADVRPKEGLAKVTGRLRGPDPPGHIHEKFPAPELQAAGVRNKRRHIRACGPPQRVQRLNLHNAIRALSQFTGSPWSPGGGMPRDPCAVAG